MVNNGWSIDTRPAEWQPFFSICVPQYNRTSFLIEACRSLSCQTFRDFEICISDDCSTDAREAELLEFLDHSGLVYCYRKLERNSRYDVNLRAAIGLARGEYCFLLGNDDRLAGPESLADIHRHLTHFAPVSVAITNYRELSSGREYRRSRETGVLGQGPSVAARVFRNFSFVSGVILQTQQAKEFATERWDGSEMYQMFLGCRMIAAGGRLLGIDEFSVSKDIAIASETVDSYATKPRIENCPVTERKLPLGEIVRLVAAAVLPYQTEGRNDEVVVSVARQFLLFTCSFWLVEYRRVQSWRYAVGVYLGLRPRNILRDVPLNAWARLKVASLYLLTGLLGLTAPVGLFGSLRKYLYNFAKA